jgi:hypothetical protein
MVFWTWGFLIHWPPFILILKVHIFFTFFIFPSFLVLLN